MKAYSYDKKTKEYIGEYECQRDPLGKGFLTPANCLLVSPAQKKGKVAVCEDSEWVYKTDNRGKYRVNADDNSIVQITTLGDYNYILTDEQKKAIDGGKEYSIVKGKIVLKDHVPTTKEQIVELEAQQTPRRIREATLGINGSKEFLEDIEKQIEELRACL